MSLFAIGDFHLSLNSEKPMDVFGDRWANHTEKLIQGFSEVRDDDTTVICGDLSWGMSLEECRDDFAFVDSLPGRKIILKGNHDYYWTTVSKMKRFFSDNGFDSLEILHNNSFEYGDVSICGTRGWFEEFPSAETHDRMIVMREACRLRASLESAGDREKIVFLHYPPVNGSYRCNEILDLLKEFEVRLCLYGHLHGKSCAGAFSGWSGGTEFRLVSADYLDFKPVKLL